MKFKKKKKAITGNDTLADVCALLGGEDPGTPLLTTPMQEERIEPSKSVVCAR